MRHNDFGSDDDAEDMKHSDVEHQGGPVEEDQPLFQSSLRADQSYPGKRSVKWWPFEHMTAALLCIWLKAHPEISRSCLQGVIDILNTPGVALPEQRIKQNAQNFERRCNLAIPGVLTHKVNVTLTRTKAHDKNVQVDEEKKRGRPKEAVVSQITIPCVDLRDYVIRMLSDPSSSIEQGPKALGPDGKVHSFAQSPFAQQPLKYSRLLSFVHKRVEYLVGDYVLITPLGRQHDEVIFRIDELFYKQLGLGDPDYWSNKNAPQEKNGGRIPPLIMRGVVFKRGYKSYEPKELLALKGVVEYAAARVLQRTHVFVAIRALPTDFTVWYCQKQESDDGGPPVQYKPPSVQFTYLAWQRGDQFAWLDLFEDGCTDVNRSFTGVYGRLANTVGQGRIFLIMLLPHGVNKFQAYATVRSDLIALGQTLRYSDGQGLVSYVQGAVAHIVGDSVGQDDWCRHKGSGGSCNCSKCWMLSPNFTKVTEVSDHRNQRRTAQTDVIGLMVRDELKNTRKTSAKAREQQYGQRDELRRLDGVECDDVMQTLRDHEHLLRYGVAKLSTKIIIKGLSPTDRKILDVRLRNFPWPRGMLRADNGLQREVGKGLTMDKFVSLVYAFQTILAGLVNDKMLEFIVTIMRSRPHHMRITPAHRHSPSTTPHTHMHMGLRLEVVLCAGGLSPATLADADALAVFLIEHGVAVLGEKWLRHNTHSLLELVRSSLLATMDAGRGGSGRFESFHTWGKRGGTGLPTVKAEKYAFHLWVGRDALVLAMRGCAWGPTAQFRLGPGFFKLIDHHEGKGHLSHPVIRRLMGGESVLKVAGTEVPAGVSDVRVLDGNGWQPANPRELDAKRSVRRPRTPPLNLTELGALRDAVTVWNSSLPAIDAAAHVGIEGAEHMQQCEHHGEHDRHGNFRHPCCRAASLQRKDTPIMHLKSGLKCALPSGKVETVKCGDDVELQYEAGSTDYGTVERIIAVVVGGRCLVWVFVLWYYKRMQSGNFRDGPRVQDDKLRNTKLVTRRNAEKGDVFAPVPVRTLLERVHMQHRCTVLSTADRKTVWHAKDSKTNRMDEKKACAVRRTCTAHADHACKAPACEAQFTNWVRRMCHSTCNTAANPDIYEVFTQSEGFRPRREETAADDDDDGDFGDDGEYPY
jgi:hypothetical protein